MGLVGWQSTHKLKQKNWLWTELCLSEVPTNFSFPQRAPSSDELESGVPDEDPVVLDELDHDGEIKRYGPGSSFAIDTSRSMIIFAVTSVKHFWNKFWDNSLDLGQFFEIFFGIAVGVRIA